MKKIMFMLVAVAAMASSCTQSDVIGLSSDDNVEIRVSAGITSAVSPSTRAVVEGMINSNFAEDLDVAFVRADEGDAGYGDYGGTALVGTVAHANKTLSFSSPVQYYLASGKKTKLIGWYPRSAGVSYTQASREVNFGDIDGKTDMMATVLYEGSKGTKIPSIAFNHLLTQFSIKVYAPDAATQALWGRVTAITITGKKQNCTITLPEKTANAGVAVSPTFTGTADLDLVKADPTTPTTAISYPLTLGVGATAASAVLAGYAMFAPQANGTSAVELQINTETGGLQKPTVAIPTGGFLPGNAYEITLKFSSSAITPTVSVVDWVPVTNTPEVEI